MSAEYVNCPNCHQKKLGPYNTSGSNHSATRGTCPHCGERYVIEYGRGQIKARPE